VPAFLFIAIVIAAGLLSVWLTLLIPSSDADVIGLLRWGEAHRQAPPSTLHCVDELMTRLWGEAVCSLAANREGTFNADPLGIDLLLFGL
jgi:hypothetical protein